MKWDWLHGNFFGSVLYKILSGNKSNKQFEKSVSEHISILVYLLLFITKKKEFHSKYTSTMVPKSYSSLLAMYAPFFVPFAICH